MAMSSTLELMRAIVQETPAIDVHSHQGTNGVWQAGDLWELFSYHWLATDIRCAGCPREIFTSADMTSHDRMKAAIPYVEAARNTVNSWCFMNIARELYGFQHTTLDQYNWQWLWDAVAEKAKDTTWENKVFDASNVVMASAGYHHAARLPQRYFMYEYGEYMFCPGMNGNVQACLARLGTDLHHAESMAKAIQNEVERLVNEHNIRALHVWVPLTWSYTPIEPKAAEVLLHKLEASVRMQEQELDQLVSFTADCLAEVCGKLGIVIQLFCGSLNIEPGGPQVSVYRPEWLRSLIPYFSRFTDTHFDLYLATRPISHEAAVLARNYPNLHLSGAWWQGFTPTTLSTFFRDRCEMLPMNKWNAFYSDAYCVEWIYGKASLTRNRLAFALASLIDEGFITRDTAEDIARCVLHDNAINMYGLK